MDYIKKLLSDDENWDDVATGVDLDAFTAELRRTIEEESSLSQPVCLKTGHHVPQSGITQVSHQEARHTDFQHMNKQATVSEQGANAVHRSEQFRPPFTQMVGLLCPQLDKERSRELLKMYLKLKNKEISRAGFLQIMIRIAGQELFNTALSKYITHVYCQVGERNFQRAAKQSQGVAEAQNLSMPSPSAPQFRETSVQLHQKGQNTLMNLSPKISCSVQQSGHNASVRESIVGQKKQSETSSQPSSSKKQKVSSVCMDQSVEQLNDVTAITGIDLREEENLLFNGKKDNLVSEASRRAAREEEGRLILQRAPLQKKLKDIMLRSGITSISDNVEQCLSACVEERMLQLITKLIRQSKQRIHVKKLEDRSHITSDIRQQILMLNQKSQEEWRKKRAETEGLQGLKEIKSNRASDGGEEKEEGGAKANMANKDGIHWKTKSANAAARSAIGGSHMQPKWLLNSVQAPVASSSQSSLSGRCLKKVCHTEERGSASSITPGSATNLVKADEASNPRMVEQSISVRDLIAVLEKEPQMSRSPLLYRLYNQVPKTESSAKSKDL